MPCWTEYEMPVATTVAFKAENEKLLIDGLLAAGFRVTQRMLSREFKDYNIVAEKGARLAEINLQNGTLTTRDESIVNEIKRAYSMEVVEQSAKQFGWSLTATDEENVFVAGRRF